MLLEKQSYVKTYARTSHRFERFNEAFDTEGTKKKIHNFIRKVVFVTYYFEGFAMHWEYSSGHCNFSISRSTPQMTRQLNTRSAKEWTMGTSPRRFAQDGAYAYYRRFTAKILDKVRDTWRVSLDDEE